MQRVIVIVLCVIIIFTVVGRVLYINGSSDGYREATDKHLEDLKKIRSEHCCPGDVQPCVFGSGIVGIKNCIRTTWDQCEPDPRYLVPKMVP
jgi:hypothetical protein